MTTPRRSARRLVRRWWPVVLAVPLGAAAGAGYAVVAHPSYAANAYVLVVAQNPGEAALATNFAQAYGRLAGQPQVLAVAADETGHTRSQLETLVHGTTSPDAPMIEITGTGPRPQDAAGTADAVARSLVAFANTSSKDTNVRLVTLAPAAAPDKPTTPSGKLDVAVGGSAGLLLGALVMMTRRRGGAGTPEAEGSREAPRVPWAARAARAVRAGQAPEAPAAAAPVAVPAPPRPRREEPAGTGPEAVAGSGAEGARTESAETETETETESARADGAEAEGARTENADVNANAERTKAEDVKAVTAKKEGAKATRAKKESPKAEKKADGRTDGKADKQTGTEPAAAEQPPAEEQALATGEGPGAPEQRTPAIARQATARKKAPAGSDR